MAPCAHLIRGLSMGATLDPRKAHLVRQHGDIIAIYTWVNDERALVLIPAHRKPGSPWFVVCESAAYRYDNPHYLAKQARKAAEVIGMDETQAAWFKIASIIIEGLGDLIRMPMGIPHGIFNKSDRTVKCFFWVSPTRRLYDLFWGIHNMAEQNPDAVVALAAKHEVDFLPPPDEAK